MRHETFSLDASCPLNTSKALGTTPGKVSTVTDSCVVSRGAQGSTHTPHTDVNGRGVWAGTILPVHHQLGAGPTASGWICCCSVVPQPLVSGTVFTASWSAWLSVWGCLLCLLVCLAVCLGLSSLPLGLPGCLSGAVFSASWSAWLSVWVCLLCLLVCLAVCLGLSSLPLGLPGCLSGSVFSASWSAWPSVWGCLLCLLVCLAVCLGLSIVYFVTLFFL